MIRPAFAPLLAGALLSGCITGQHERMKNQLDPVVGDSIASFIALHGDPSTFVKTGDSQAAFRWVITGPGIGGVVPIGTSAIVVPAGQRACVVVLNASTKSATPEFKDWIIDSWQWQGAC